MKVVKKATVEVAVTFKDFLHEFSRDRILEDVLSEYTWDEVKEHYDSNEMIEFIESLPEDYVVVNRGDIKPNITVYELQEISKYLDRAPLHIKLIHEEMVRLSKEIIDPA